MTENKQTTLSVILPCYNEEATVKQTIEELLKETHNEILQTRITKKIIIVDDGSTDKSPEIIDEYKNYPNIKIIHKKNGGKGSAIKAATPYCDSKYIIIQDCDLEYKPNDYPLLLFPASMGFKAIIGSRKMNPYNECNQKGRFSFSLGGNALTWFANLLYGTRVDDWWCGYKVIETKLFKSLNLESDGFETCAETVAKLAKKRIRIYNIPISYFPRKLEEGKKIRWTDGLKLARELIRQKLK